MDWQDTNAGRFLLLVSSVCLSNGVFNPIASCSEAGCYQCGKRVIEYFNIQLPTWEELMEIVPAVSDKRLFCKNRFTAESCLGNCKICQDDLMTRIEPPQITYLRATSMDRNIARAWRDLGRETII